jgi:hypothetical protein
MSNLQALICSNPIGGRLDLGSSASSDDETNHLKRRDEAAGNTRLKMAKTIN